VGASAGEAPDAAEISPRAQASIDRGLAFLASTQRADGSWPGQYGDTTGIVGACALAFMGAGNTPGRGQYGKHVARAIQFLVRKAQPDGLLYQNGMQGMPMYHHGLACLAVGEAWGATQERRLRDVLKLAVQRIITSQNKEGGWRYYARAADDDLSVTVMELLALRAAKDAGIFVPKDVIDAGIGYVKKCANARDGGFGYRPGGESGFARTGAGVLSLQVAGDYRAAEVKNGIEYLLRHKPVGAKSIDDWYFYGHYYAAQSIYQAQGMGEWGRRAWQAWYPGAVTELSAKQRPDGSWDGGHGAYSSAMALLVLEIPYRYLPIYQR